jgi:hypothetical protein
MSRSGSRPTPDPTCWDCGAPNDPGSSECWLCQRRDWNRYPDRRRGRPARQRGPLATIGGQMLAIAAIAVTMAICVLAPPVGVVLLISALPALFITEFMAFRRRRRGEWVSGWQRFRWFIYLTIMIPILLVAVAIAVFAVCAAFMR